MLKPSIFTVFRSRWRALWWAAGVLLTAYCAIPAPEPGAQPEATQTPARSTNPWAKDAPRE